MTTQNIFDIVMPDLHDRKQQMQSIIAKHSNPVFAEKVCAKLSPLFYFFTQKSWEILDDPLMMVVVEDWIKVANKLSLDLVKMGSWLLLLLEYRMYEDKHKQLERLLARHLVATDYHKPKFRGRMLQLIDNAGKKVGVLSLIPNNAKPPTSNEYGETYEYEEVILDQFDSNQQKSTSIESFDYEDGIPRIDPENAKLYQTELDKLEKIKRRGGLSEVQQKLLNSYHRYVRNGLVRYDKPNSDRAAASIRRGLNYFCSKLDQKVVSPKFGSCLLKTGFKSGRTCMWKEQGIINKFAMQQSPARRLDHVDWLFSVKENKAIEDARIFLAKADKENPHRQKEIDEANAVLTNILCNYFEEAKESRRFGLETLLLVQANLSDLNLINTFYEAGRQKDLFLAYDKPDALNEIYKAVKERRIDAYSGYMGDKNNLLQCMESGLEYYGII